MCFAEGPTTAMMAVFSVYVSSRFLESSVGISRTADNYGVHCYVAFSCCVAVDVFFFHGATFFSWRDGATFFSCRGFFSAVLSSAEELQIERCYTRNSLEMGCESALT